MFVRERFEFSNRIFWVLKSDWFLEENVIDVDVLLIVEIDYVVCTFCIEGTDVVCDVVCNVERELEDIVLTLLVYVDCTDYIKDEETTISSSFSFSSSTSTLVNGINYIYTKSDVSSISIILLAVSYRICTISKSIES